MIQRKSRESKVTKVKRKRIELSAVLMMLRVRELRIENILGTNYREVIGDIYGNCVLYDGVVS